MNEEIKKVPEWVRETFGAGALELGLYEEDTTRPAEDEPPRVEPRPAWLVME